MQPFSRHELPDRMQGVECRQKASEHNQWPLTQNMLACAVGVHNPFKVVLSSRHAGKEKFHHLLQRCPPLMIHLARDATDNTKASLTERGQWRLLTVALGLSCHCPIQRSG